MRNRPALAWTLLSNLSCRTRNFRSANTTLPLSRPCQTALLARLDAADPAGPLRRHQQHRFEAPTVAQLLTRRRASSSRKDLACDKVVSPGSRRKYSRQNGRRKHETLEPDLGIPVLSRRNYPVRLEPSPIYGVGHSGHPAFPATLTRQPTCSRLGLQTRPLSPLSPQQPSLPDWSSPSNSHVQRPRAGSLMRCQHFDR